MAGRNSNTAKTGTKRGPSTTSKGARTVQKAEKAMGSRGGRSTRGGAQATTLRPAR